MTEIPQNIYFASAIVGMLISLALISQVFSKERSNFFMGLVVLVLSLEILFSWGARSGYNNSQGAFPIWMLLNYQVAPPAIWIFTKFNTDDNFTFRKIHLLLFVPAIIELALQVWARVGALSLRDYTLWILFTDYLPLAGLILALAYFWYSYLKINSGELWKTVRKTWLIHIRLLLLMSALSLLCIFWVIFSFIGWKYFNLIEFLLITLFFGIAFLNFLESQAFSGLFEKKNEEFPNYNDQEQLKILNLLLLEQKLFLKPNLPLKELAAELNLPARYLSYLINTYKGRNYKEFINQYRIEEFIRKAESEEVKQKTLLALALDSGFSSKSTFNQVFKNHKGMSPSEYLDQRK